MANDNNQPASARAPSKAAEQVGLRVSLIPEQEEKAKDPRTGFGKFILALVIGIMLIAATAGILFWRAYENKKAIAAIDVDIQTIEGRSLAFADVLKDAKVSQIRLAALSGLLGGHRSGLRVFGFFEDHTLADVAFSSIVIGENAVVNLSASAGSFESYAAQINELRAQREVVSVISSGLNPVYDNKNVLKQVDFALAVTFDPSIFVNEPQK